jgi:hypothetical protein
MTEERRRPAEPTSAPAGSAEKIEAMRARRARGEALHHPDDSADCVEQRPVDYPDLPKPVADLLRSANDNHVTLHVPAIARQVEVDLWFTGGPLGGRIDKRAATIGRHATAWVRDGACSVDYESVVPATRSGQILRMIVVGRTRATAPAEVE